jgi:hypothetical protein
MERIGSRGDCGVSGFTLHGDNQSRPWTVYELASRTTEIALGPEIDGPQSEHRSAARF